MIFKNKKLNFVISFIIFYIVFLYVGLSFIGPFIINLKYKLIEILFKETISSQLLFVSHCSGVISVATYFAIVVGFLSVKEKTSFKNMLISTLILITYNLLRLIIIVYAATKSITLADTIHTISWFVVFGILILLVFKDYKKIKI